MPLPVHPNPLKLAALACALLFSPWVAAADGHAAPAAVALPAKPVAAKPAAAATAPEAHAATKPAADAPSALPSDELARRLQERIARVRAAQAQVAHKAKPAAGHRHHAAPSVKMGIVAAGAGANRRGQYR